MQGGLGLRGVGLFALLSLITLASSVTAADYTCDDVNQRIFRISAQTNAHGEFYNEAGNYLQHICYDDYFGTFLETPTRSPCSGDNVVVRLSGATNAHAELSGRSTAGYSDICFDETLVCTNVAAPAECAADYFEIASISANTNAHLGLPNQYATAGNYRICCKLSTLIPQCSDGIDNDGDTFIDFPNDPECTSAQDNDETDGVAGETNNFTQLQWQNNAGSPIGDLYGLNSSVNFTVRMASWTRFPIGTNLTFEVWEDDPLSDDYIRSFTTLTTLGTPVSEGVIDNYRITDADIEAGRSEFADDDRGESYEEFYFKVYTTDALLSSEINKSYALNVSVAMGTNAPPVANINSPVHRGVYYVGATLLFNQSSYDREGGALSYYWTIDEDGFNSAERNFTYLLASPGQKTITLRVTDERGAWNEHQIGIVVVASPGMFAYINNPEHHRLLVNRALQVIVSSEESYVINSEGTCPAVTITCIAGVCPTETQNSPPECGGEPLPITGGPRGFNELYFDWGFSDGDIAPAADGLGNVTIMKQFGLPSGSLTDYKRVDLRLNYTESPITPDGISIELVAHRLFTLLDAHQCVDEGRTWVEYDFTTGQRIGTWSTMQSNNRCQGSDDLSGTDDDCCPTRYTCTGTPLAACVPVDETICADYRSKDSCDNDIYNLAENDPGWDEECESGRAGNGSIVTCGCHWSGNGQGQQTGNSCVLRKEYRQGSGGNNGCTPHSCDYLPTSEPTECINGYATVTVRAQFTPGTCTIPPASDASATCLAGTGVRTILCGRPTISLDFFGPWQFIITFIAILCVYWIVWLRQRT